MNLEVNMKHLEVHRKDGVACHPQYLRKNNHKKIAHVLWIIKDNNLNDLIW